MIYPNNIWVMNHSVISSNSWNSWWRVKINKSNPEEDKLWQPYAFLDCTCKKYLFLSLHPPFPTNSNVLACSSNLWTQDVTRPSSQTHQWLAWKMFYPVLHTIALIMLLTQNYVHIYCRILMTMQPTFNAIIQQDTHNQIRWNKIEGDAEGQV